MAITGPDGRRRLEELTSHPSTRNLFANGVADAVALRWALVRDAQSPLERSRLLLEFGRLLDPRVLGPDQRRQLLERSEAERGYGVTGRDVRSQLVGMSRQEAVAHLDGLVSEGVIREPLLLPTQGGGPPLRVWLGRDGNVIRVHGVDADGRIGGFDTRQTQLIAQASALLREDVRQDLWRAHASRRGQTIRTDRPPIRYDPSLAEGVATAGDTLVLGPKAFETPDSLKRAILSGLHGLASLPTNQGESFSMLAVGEVDG